MQELHSAPFVLNNLLSEMTMEQISDHPKGLVIDSGYRLTYVEHLWSVAQAHRSMQSLSCETMLGTCGDVYSVFALTLRRRKTTKYSYDWIYGSHKWWRLGSSAAARKSAAPSTLTYIVVCFITVLSQRFNRNLHWFQLQ